MLAPVIGWWPTLACCGINAAWLVGVLWVANRHDRKELG